MMIERFHFFVEERRRILWQRHLCVPPPWTQDERLRMYWFPNIDREDDPSTIWLRANCHTPSAVFQFRCLGGNLKVVDAISDTFNETKFLSTAGPHPFNSHVYYLRQPPGLRRVVNAIKAFEGNTHLLFRIKRLPIYKAWETIQDIKWIGPELAWDVLCDLREEDWAAPTKGVMAGASLLLDRPATPADAMTILSDVRGDLTYRQTQRALSMFRFWAQDNQPLRRYHAQHHGA